MNNLFAPHAPLRIFAFSILATITILAGVLFGVGFSAFILTLILSVVELTFSFDNAIINAKVLKKLSKPWQTAFLTVGIIIAIFGMRVVFPVVIVMITADLSWSTVVDLALNHSHEYAHHLEKAHPSIAAFGGAFLLMLGLKYFMDDQKDVHWIQTIEKPFRKFSHWLAAPAIVVVAILALTWLPANTHGSSTITAGLLGAGTYILIQSLTHLFTRLQGDRLNISGQTGLAALSTFLYLEILDASFSFDGVIGAFAITSNVILIAAGLGIGAIWVRSLTVYMVRHEVLGKYKFIEHGAHYTVLVLAILLLTSVIVEISDYIPGLLGIGIIGASIYASIRANRPTSTKKLA